MLYDCNNPALRIVGVEHIKWGGGAFEVAPREYSALAFRIKGSATISCECGEYFVNTNDILYLPQNMPYTAKYNDTEMIVLHFVTEKDDKNVELYTFQNDEEIYKAFLRAHHLWENKEPGFSVYVMSQLYKILGLINEKQTRQSLPPHFLKAVSFINLNYKDNSLSVDSICSYAAISATTLRLLFRNHYKKSPIEYITDLRLEYARNLISGGMSIESAALESGFNDPKYFARVVKKQFGCTPRALKSYGK